MRTGGRFEHNLVPQVISEPSADSKYAVLVEGVYHYYFDVNFGARQNKQQSRLARQVKEAKALKNDAGRVLMPRSQPHCPKCKSVPSQRNSSSQSVLTISSRGRSDNPRSGLHKSSPSSMS